MGFSPDNVRIRDAFEIAKKKGFDFTYIINSDEEIPHPNRIVQVLSIPMVSARFMNFYLLWIFLAIGTNMSMECTFLKHFS